MTYRKLILAFALFPALVFQPLAWTQTDQAGDIPYLLRMERERHGANICVLVRGDGQYHFEKLDHDRTRIFDGSIDPSTLQTLVLAVSSDELFHLTQEQIKSPLLIGETDQVIVSVLRPGHWQDLNFLSPESRKPYEQSVDPLLKWLDTIQKEKHVNLKEEAARNNCLPPGKIELKARPAPHAQPAPSEPPSTSTGAAEQNTLVDFVLRVAVKRFTGSQAENTCAIVYKSGRYRFERTSQHVRSTTITTEIFEEVVGATELQQLMQILDAPELHNWPSQDPPARGAIREGEFIFLNVPRNGAIQKLNFWRYTYSGHSNYSAFPGVEDHGVKHLKPLNQWLKENVEDRKVAPLADAPLTNCVPTKQP